VCCPSTCRLPLGYELDHLPGVDFSHADLHPKACTALIHMINRAVVGCLPTWCTGLLCWMLPHVLYSLQSCCCWLLVLQGCSDCLLLCTEGRFILPTAAALRRIFWVESSFYMGQRLICKQVLSASVTRKSLDVDLTVDENLAPKPPHHYLAKLCNPPPPRMSLRLDPHPKFHEARLHSSRSLYMESFICYSCINTADDLILVIC
jgi:hypothetical protein